MDSSRHTNADSSVPLSALERVDRAGDRFEDAWEAGQRPAIEAFLADSPEPGRPLLLRELLGLDLGYRRRAGETPDATEYLGRFPEHAAVIHEVFTETPVAGSCPEDPSAASQATPPERGSVVGQGRPSDSSRQTPLTEVTAAAGAWPVVPGYEILGELGHGGMGVVYRARHLGLKRVVALKMIRAGAQAGAEELARFRAEARFQASVHHPHIVQIFEIGEAAGLPYFALEYVDGTSLDKRLAGRPQPARSAAQLIETLARTIHHAHAKGLVHRDLKPGNILLASDATPKVGDFGLAKRLEGEAGRTQTGAVVGTPSYMAPEQAWGRVKAIGPAADIYALGGILYELLTGRPPFLGASAVDTVLQVRHQEPVPPRHWLANVPRDLETICLKCLRKEPGQRYSSAEALADDLRRFLEGKPVVARPVSLLVRAVRWARRRPAVAALLLALALVVSGSVAGLTVLWLRAERNSTRAQDAEADSQAAMNFLTKEILGVSQVEVKGAGVTLGQAVDAAAPKITEVFADRPKAEAPVRQAVGLIYHRMGNYTQAEPHLRRAADLYREHLGAEHLDTLTAANHLALLLLDCGKLAEAEPLFRRNLEAYRRIRGADDPETLPSANNLALVLHKLGRLDEAQSLFEQTLEARRRILGPDHPDTLTTANNLAALLQNRGKWDEATALLRDNLEHFRRRLGNDHSHTLTAVNNLASLLMEQGKLAEAEPLLGQNLEVLRRISGPEHPTTLKAVNNLGMLLFDRHNLAEAEPLLRQNLEDRRRILGPDHSDTLTSENNLALVFQAQGQFQKAEALFRQSLESCRRTLGPEHFATLRTMNNLSGVLQDQGKLAEAESLQRQLLECSRHALSPEHPYSLAIASNLASLFVTLNKLAEAEMLLRECCETYRRTLGPEHRNTLRATNNLAVVLYRQGKLAESETLFREALQGRRKLLPEGHPDIANSLDGLGGLLFKRGKAAEAEPLLRECLAIRRRTLTKGHQEIAGTEGWLGSCLTTLGRYAEAEALLLNCFQTLTTAQGVSKKRRQEALDRIIQLYEAWGKPDKAAQWRAKGIK
jgi:non-specific serine/threonine protein kinase/serine/threonine-protein kinase